MRTLLEQEAGFHVERGKRRNLLNSAGGDVRTGTLGSRTRVRVLRENDAARNARRRSNPSRTTRTLPEVTTPATRESLRVLHHDVASLVVRSIALGLDPANVATLARRAQGIAHDTTRAVSLGAGRGW